LEALVSLAANVQAEAGFVEAGPRNFAAPADEPALPYFGAQRNLFRSQANAPEALRAVRG
jgi:hypothetical protein